MDQIGLFFKCQSCSDYVLTSNIQCPNGHQVCHVCFENLSHCPTCHQRVALSTRIPFLLTANVDPILNVTGDSFDLLLPSLLRIAPALHPCTPDEMIFTGSKATNLHLNLMNNDSNNIMQKNNNLADQLLMANHCGEVEETLSRLMMLASMSSGQSPTLLSPLQSTIISTTRNDTLVGNTSTSDLQSIINNDNIHESVPSTTPTSQLLSSSSASPSATSSAMMVDNNNTIANSNDTVLMNTSTTNQPIGSLMSNNQNQQNIDGFPEF